MLFDEVSKHHYKSLREIYDDISALHPSSAIQRSWASMELRMRMWKKQTLPKNPRSLRQYLNILREPRWSFYTEFQNVDGSLHVATLRAQDGSYVTVYGNIEMLTLMSNVIELFIDATFKVVPSNPKVLQLLTIMALIQDTVIPIFWCLMEKKTLSAYFTALNYFSSVMAPQMNPLIIMSDFEVAVSQAVRYICIPKCLASTLLFPLLSSYSKGIWKIEITSYIQTMEIGRQWIQRTRPENFSVYGANNRTNNFCESHYRILNKRFVRHPSIWKFTDHLKRWLKVLC
ncbi:uncharacterized protein [Chelonus insularis]|uniref:uncharacterized protein n=1 Tax=Chelonus insularis TaxID=460826 RepID=UPI0015889DBB|nr:uncharacterized protein LOC118071434 [Chelonus insularis]